MKTTVTVTPKEAKTEYVKYPYFGRYAINKNDEIIIFFTEEDTGLCLKDNYGREGVYKSSWEESQFEPFIGTITITQES